MSWPINNAGVDLLKHFETFVDHAYPDPMSPLGKALQARGLWQTALRDAKFMVPTDLVLLDGKPWTYGYGFTDNVSPGDLISMEEADERLEGELADTVQCVNTACTVPANENQLAAMVCCAFNIGKAGFLGSSIIRAHNRGDFQGAARAFRLWDKSNGQVVEGLTRRRAAESDLYLKPVGADLHVMAQRVDPESSLMASPIVRGGMVTGGASALGVVGDAARTISDVRYSLGDWLPWVLIGVALIGLGAAGYVLFMRWKQRRLGWA